MIGHASSFPKARRPLRERFATNIFTVIVWAGNNDRDLDRGDRKNIKYFQ